MQQNAALIRIRTLLEKGRYQKRVLRDAEGFVPVNITERIRLDGIEYAPFIDRKEGRMIYGQVGQRPDARFHILSFSRYDFHQGEDDPYVWVDKDPGGFEHLD